MVRSFAVFSKTPCLSPPQLSYTDNATRLKVMWLVVETPKRLGCQCGRIKENHSINKFNKRLQSCFLTRLGVDDCENVFT